MDPFKNYFCDSPKRYFELNDLIDVYFNQNFMRT